MRRRLRDNRNCKGEFRSPVSISFICERIISAPTARNTEGGVPYVIQPLDSDICGRPKGAPTECYRKYSAYLRADNIRPYKENT